MTQPTAGEILGAFQLGLINQEEAREALGFSAKPATIEVVK